MIVKSYSRALWWTIFSTGPIQQPELVKEHENDGNDGNDEDFENDEDDKDVEKDEDVVNDAAIIAPRPHRKCYQGRRLCFGKKRRGKKWWTKHERFTVL